MGAGSGAAQPQVGAPRRRPDWRTTLLVVVVAGSAVACAARAVRPGLVLDLYYDPDTVVVLEAFDDDPSLAYVLSWYVSDGPQRVHTFRPLQYTVLRLLYPLCGWTPWRYQVVNAGLYWLTIAGLVALLRRCGASTTLALLAAAATMAVPTAQNHVVIYMICTLGDLLCGLFAVWAVWALVVWLDGGSRRWLAGYLALLLAAFLSKEMALGVALAAMAVTAIWPGSRRRRWWTVAATAGLSLAWLGWFKLAESAMPAGHLANAHTFGDLAARLAAQPGKAALHWLHAICRPAWQMVYMWVAGVRDFWWVGLFWRNLPLLVLWPLGVVLVARRHPQMCRVWLCWNAVTYLPVLPLHDNVPWYQYIPDLLDRAFTVLAAAAIVRSLWSWWEENSR